MLQLDNHTGYYSCERCTVEGTYESSRVVFTEIDCESRDDESFRNEAYMGTHQIGRSCSIDTGIDCVSKFPLDYMLHIVCLGVIKRLLMLWREGPRNFRLSPVQLSRISEKLREYRGKMPTEFVRQSFLNYATQLLRYFVSLSREFYGDNFVVYNVHNLIHLWEDCHNYDTSLDNISSFPFKNYLQVIKKFVNKAQNPLPQVVKRVEELENFAMNDASHKDAKTTVLTTEKDSWFLLSSGNFAQIKEINDNSLSCKVISKHYFQNLYREPCDSKNLNVVYVRNLNAASRREIGFNLLLRKAICLPYKDGFVLTSQLHNVKI